MGRREILAETEKFGKGNFPTGRFGRTRNSWVCAKWKIQKCLEDLIKQKDLKSEKYGIVHFESKDYRGIDNALDLQEEGLPSYQLQNFSK